MAGIRENLQIIQENIADAARKSGRRAEDIVLIAVSKTVGLPEMEEAQAAGITRFGENKVQELSAKYHHINPAPEWHMIGHLQTNKVKQVIDKVSMIQSVDSIRLAEEINKRALQAEKRIDVLIEINIGNEVSKYGIEPDQTERFIEHLYKFANVRVKGLMCVAPFIEKPENNRFVYSKMSKLFVDMTAVFNHNTDMQYLSMGMTNDYTVAIEEGANMVRIGTALFGSRN